MRKKGEEQPHQENAGSQTTRSVKEKGKQAAAAAKLERFTHTPVQSPVKGNQQAQVKTQRGAPEAKWQQYLAQKL